MARCLTFPKAEHLCLRSDIDALFVSGSRAITIFPIRMVFRTVDRSEHQPPVQVLLSVPKRKFRHAVDRNRVKRLLREAYRRYKHLLLDALPPQTGFHLAFLWLSGKLPTAAEVETIVPKLLQRLGEQVVPLTPAEGHE